MRVGARWVLLWAPYGGPVVMRLLKEEIVNSRGWCFFSEGITIKKIGDFFFLEHGTLRLRWDATNTFFLTIEQSEALSNISKSVGLCGNNNANPFGQQLCFSSL